MPVLPLALCNGADGIGTGWATSVPNYDPKQLIAVLRRMIAHAGDDVDCDETSLLATCAAEDVGADGLAPSYRGFKGDVILKKAGSYQALGRVERLDDTKVLIDELPLRKWTHDYKQCARAASSRFPTGPCARGALSIPSYAGDATQAGAADRGDDKTTAWLKDFKENHHTDTTVSAHPSSESQIRVMTNRGLHAIDGLHATTRPWVSHWLICSQVSFTVTALSGAKLDEAEKAPGGLLKKFKLESSMATSNMNFFDSGGVAIERYATPFDIWTRRSTKSIGDLREAQGAHLRPLTRRWRPTRLGVRDAASVSHAVDATRVDGV